MFNFSNWTVLIYGKKMFKFFQKQKHLLFLNSEMTPNTTDTCDRKEEGPRGK